MEQTHHHDETSLTKSQQMVRELLAERMEMLVAYNRLAGTAPFAHADATRLERQQLALQKFCQLLMDYTATGHFGLYESLKQKGACQEEVWNLAESLFPEIASTTDQLLEFNDKYNCEDHCPIGELHDDLSQLGEVLAARIELEDRITEPVCSGCPECLPA
jgi:regulator of sigma D